MKFLHVMIAAALALLAVPASAASLSDDDAAFLKTAIQIQAGRYAMASYEEQHGTGAVKKFAASVALQATKDSRMLDKLAKHYGVTPDKGLLIQDKYHYSKLAGLSGTTLNNTFARELRISDQINLDSYKQMRDAQNATLKDYAKKRYAQVKQEISTLRHF